MALAAAIACGSSAGDMMGEAFNDVGDVPDAGAQEPGPQGEPGLQGETGSQGEPGHPVVFCADFGAFCGFSAETLESMSDCKAAISELDDAGVVCTARNLHAAKSGDTGGCGAIANLDPCSFTPTPPPAPTKAVAAATIFTPDAVPTADATHPYPWFCEFDTGNQIDVGEGQQLLLKIDGTLRRTTGGDSFAGVAYREAGDSSDGTVLGSSGLRQGLGSEFLVSQTFVTDALTAGTYQIGLCVMNHVYCPLYRDDGCPEYEAIIYGSKITGLALDLQ